MQTRMMTHLDNVESKLSNLKSVLKSHNLMFKEHSIQLNSLLTSVNELSKTVSSLSKEMRNGFQDNPIPPNPMSSFDDASQPLLKQVELPSFIDKDPVEWLVKAKLYFSI